MKYLIFAMMFGFAGVLGAQQDYDCNDYIEVTEDRMTGETSVGMKESIVVSQDGGRSGLGILLMKSSSGSIIFSIVAAGNGSCIDDDAQMIVLFRDGSRLELTNDGDFNCDGRYTQYFLGVFGKRRMLRQFQEKQIEAIRVSMRRGFVEEDFTEDNSLVFKRTLNCLMD